MMSSVKDCIVLLKKAQEIDREAYLAGIQLEEEIPAARAMIKQELETEKTHLSELDGSLKKTQLTQKEKEGQLAEKEAHIKKLDGQLSLLKTNKEYSAMQQEIASLKADNSLLEEDIIKILDQVEAIEEEVRKERERLKEVEKRTADEEKDLAEREKKHKGSIEQAKKTRDEIINQLPPDIKDQYNLIVSKKQGLALVPIKGENCGACHLLLRPQVINEVQMGERLVTCEACQRILYIE